MAEEQQESLRDLRSAADEGRKAKRELAFVKAGIDTDTPLGKMFAAAYDGDLTKEAIGERWAEVAPAQPEVETTTTEATDPAEQVSMEDQRAAQDRARRAIASTPAEPVPEQTVDPLQAGYAEFHQNLRDGVARDTAAKPVFDAIITSAANGDKRFIWDGAWTDDEMRDGKVSRA